jgi:predicted PurR-regulated permease PerM
MSVPENPPVSGAVRRAVIIVAVLAVVAVLFLARQVLVPVCFALMLSFAVLPAVRGLGRLGLGRGVAVPTAILALVVILGGIIAMLGAQVVHLARSLPTYEATIHSRMHVIHHLTLGSLEALEEQVGNLLRTDDATPAVPGAPPPALAATTGPDSQPLSAVGVLTRIASSAWAPVQATAIVLAVLAFVLLEHESLRDRFIRLVGGADLRATTEAINDAGERLSRYFLSTLSVNAGVGIALWLGLTIAGLPNAPLWAVATALMRFVPYIGVWLMAGVVAIFAIAVAPGWSLVITALAIYLAVELMASQVIEPLLYGRMTGLSPLAVLVSAIFWSWLWGPVGLVMSTPLTLCLLVAGRHVQALAPLNILLGDGPALTRPQHFYQRALAGDAGELINEARMYMKHRPFASYCDAVLIPAVQLARIDLDAGLINGVQQVTVRRVVENVIESAGRSAYARRPDFHADPTPDTATMGQRLRQRREGADARRASSAKGKPGDTVICISLGTHVDDFVAEILTRVLSELGIKARHISVKEFEASGTAMSDAERQESVSMVFIVTALPSRGASTAAQVAATSRLRTPQAQLVLVCVPEPFALRSDTTAQAAAVDGATVVESLEGAAQLAIARFPKPSR